MKTRKIITRLSIVFCLLFAFGLMAALFCIAFPKKYITAFIVAISISGAGFIGFVITSVLYATPSKERKERWKSYAVAEPQKSIDFKAELEQVRQNYDYDKSEDKNHIEKLPKGSDTELLNDFSVLKNGKIYYGFLVMANGALFKRSYFRSTYPGVIVYSPDEYFESHPYELRKIAEYLYANRNANALRDESTIFTNMRIRDEREVYMTVVPFYRMHLPFTVLAGGLFPVIADPAHSSSVLVVDEKYWTETLGSNFVYGDPADTTD
ncbi:MAG: glycine/sarcosine/betaine reductase component B subunit, partial [Clostridia bacterium]|nr:glycine/sarcosine/betaine reductase component B subunit [Clostridia bacterium]